jgi:transglutaminase-like putative cysteine protease
MAHTPSTSVRVQRLTALVAICAVAIAVGFAFGRILVGHGATWRLLGVGLASAVIAWATERRGMLVATAASAVGLVLACAWLAAPSTTWFGVPTAETFRTLLTLAGQVGGQAREYVSPAPMTPALILAGTIAVWAAVFSCYALAFRAQSPLLGLVPPLALIVFADSVLEEVVRPLYGIVFLFAAIAVLFADSLRRLQGWGPIWSPSGNRDRLVPIASRNARRVGLTAVTLAVLAPVLMPGFGQRAVFSLSSINSDHRVRLSPLVSMKAVLTGDDRDDEIFTVQASEPSYWRMAILDTYDGTTWQPDTSDAVPIASGAQIPGVVAAGTPDEQTVTMLADGAFSWLVAAATPQSITIDHDVTWSRESQSLQMDGWPDAGESYTVTSVRLNPTIRDLKLVGTSAEPSAMTAIPDDLPAVIEETAKQWTDGLSSDYEKIQAIVANLHQFAYSTDVDYGDYGDDPSSLETMLTTTKTGFCQQFASLLAMMLRSIHIPARVGLGFATGTPTTTPDSHDAWVVRMRDYHSWVEVPFQGYGWLPFDATPTFAGDPSAPYVRDPGPEKTCPQNRPRCDAGGPRNQDGIGGGEHNVKGGTLNEEHRNFVGDLSLGPVPNDEPFPYGRMALLLVVMGLIGAIAIPVLRAARRRRRLRAAREPRQLILATYDVFGERAAELGWPRGPGETPREYRTRLGAVEGLDDDARTSLERMTAAVVEAAYAAGSPDTTASKETTADASTVLSALRHSASWRERLVGLYRRD